MQTNFIYDYVPHLMHFDHKFTGKERDPNQAMTNSGPATTVPT